jgi:hypothetical protein
MKFYVLYRIQEDNRAPEFPRLEDYEDAGIVEADTRTAAMAAMGRPEDIPELERKRPLRTGDILKDQMNRAFIVTPNGQLALATLVEE